MKTKIIVLAKNEQRYLEEWITYHLGLGFSAIDIYEDYGSNSHKNIVSKFSNVNLMKLEDVLNSNYAKYGTAGRYRYIVEKALIEDRDKFDWLACIDVDEFIMFDKKYTLRSFLQEFQPYPGVYLYWKYMSANGHVSKCENVMSSYTEESSYSGIEQFYFKCFFNMKRNFMLYNHCHHCAKYGVNTAKIPFLRHDAKEFKQKKTYSKAWINHYFTKSWEDWCERIYEKGNLTYNIRKLFDFFDYNPDMIELKDQLIAPLIGKRPRSTLWLDKDETLLYTGKRIDKETSGKLKKLMAKKPIDEVQDYIERYLS